MPDPILLFSGSSGLNTIVDPVRIQYNPETGVTDLALAVNVSIDDTGRISRRKGQRQLQSGEFHSIFCDTGNCFVVEERVSDAAIMQLATDYSLTGLRSSLAKDRRMSFCQIGSQTFYTNGLQNGVIENSISLPWPEQAHVGAETSRSFSGAPLGTHIAFFAGRMWISEGSVLWYSEPYAYGKFDLARSFIWLGSDIRMIKPVATGLFVSDSTATWFFQGTVPKEMTQDQVSSIPVHEWSDAIGLVDGKDFGIPEAGLCAVWSSDRGLHLGIKDGSVIDLTVDKLVYPSGVRGASLFNGSTILNTVE